MEVKQTSEVSDFPRLFVALDKSVCLLIKCKFILFYSFLSHRGSNIALIAHQSLFICAFPLRATEYGLQRSWWYVALSSSSGERSVFTHDNDNIITEAQTFTEKLFALTKLLPSYLLLSHIYPTFAFLLSAHANFIVLLKLPTFFPHFYPKLNWIVNLSDYSIVFQLHTIYPAMHHFNSQYYLLTSLLDANTFALLDISQ